MTIRTRKDCLWKEELLIQKSVCIKKTTLCTNKDNTYKTLFVQKELLTVDVERVCLYHLTNKIFVLVKVEETTLEISCYFAVTSYVWLNVMGTKRGTIETDIFGSYHRNTDLLPPENGDAS